MKLKFQWNTNGIAAIWTDKDTSTDCSNAWLLCENSADCIKIVAQFIHATLSAASAKFHTKSFSA